MSQYDVAAALYRERAHTVYYLDSDPVEAARQACDYHVRMGVNSALAVLSSVWHQLNPQYLPLDEEAPFGSLFARRTPPASTRHPVLQADRPDAFYAEYSGDQPYFLLMGQRIPARPMVEPTAVSWAATSAPNYSWVWAWGMAMAAEHKHRWGTYPAGYQQLWTLEAVPPHLPPEPYTQPEPDVTADSLFEVDGYYDTVGSYQLFYVRQKLPLLTWTGRSMPDWVTLRLKEVRAAHGGALM